MADEQPVAVAVMAVIVDHVAGHISAHVAHTDKPVRLEGVYQRVAVEADDCALCEEAVCRV